MEAEASAHALCIAHSASGLDHTVPIARGLGQRALYEEAVATRSESPSAHEEADDGRVVAACASQTFHVRTSEAGSGNANRTCHDRALVGSVSGDVVAATVSETLSWKERDASWTHVASDYQSQSWTSSHPNRTRNHCQSHLKKGPSLTLTRTLLASARDVAP